MSPHKGYMNIAIAAMLFAAAFAGVVFIADEDVAAAEESASDEAGHYKVTYVVDGSTIVKKTATDDSYIFLGADAVAYKPATGYYLAGWKDVASSTVFQVGQKYTFAADITVEPVLKADRAIIKLVYGDVVHEIVAEESAADYVVAAAADAAAAENENVSNPFTDIQKIDMTYAQEDDGDIRDTDLAKFAEAIGATYTTTTTTTTTDDKSEAVAIDKLVLDGFEFKGFVDKDGKTIDGFEGIVATATATATATGESDITWTGKLDNAEPAIYTAVFEPIYNVSFVVDGTTVAKCESNVFSSEGNIKDGKSALQPIDPVKANYTFIGWAVDGKVVSEVKAGVITIPVDYKFEADTVFTAVFEPVQLTITLMIGELETTQPALYGQTITAPGLPAGYECWATKVVEMKDGAEVITYTPFDFSKPITESVTLYAQLAEKVYTITFVSEGAVIGGPYDVSKKFTIPEDPVVEGKKFVGWFVDDYKVLDVMAYIADHPEQDIVLTASFTEADAPAGPDFIDTNEGKCVLILIGVALVAFAYAVYTNMFGLKDKLTSVKLVRVKKE